MLRTTAIAAVAFSAFAAVASQAAPLDRPPFNGGGSIPIEPGILDPVNECLRFPQLCDPTEPPPSDSWSMSRSPRPALRPASCINSVDVVMKPNPPTCISISRTS